MPKRGRPRPRGMVDHAPMMADQAKQGKGHIMNMKFEKLAKEFEEMGTGEEKRFTTRSGENLVVRKGASGQDFTVEFYENGLLDGSEQATAEEIALLVLADGVSESR